MSLAFTLADLRSECQLAAKRLSHGGAGQPQPRAGGGRSETAMEAYLLFRTHDTPQKRGKIGADRLDIYALSIPQGVPDDRIGCRLPITTQVKGETVAVIGGKLKYIRRLTIRAASKQFEVDPIF